MHLSEGPAETLLSPSAIGFIGRAGSFFFLFFFSQFI